jgi:hypothetical protein
VNSVIKINAIRCVHCGEIVVSTFRHHFAPHSCAKLRELHGPDGFIAADGGTAYLRRCGHRADWEEATTWEP